METPSSADLYQHFRSEWQFTRGLTIELLASLSDDELQYTPGQGLGPFWKQFRHTGRVQEDYLCALECGELSFSPERGRYTGGCSRDKLITYLNELDTELQQKIAEPSLPPNIIWFGTPLPINEHLMRLVTHEVLHQGSWIVYMRIMGRNFPPGWDSWGL